MPIPDTVTRTLDYAGSTPMSLGAAAANRAAGVGATCALNPTSGARAECALNSTYNTHGEPLYGHSTVNGTPVNGTPPLWGRSPSHTLLVSHHMCSFCT